MNCIVEFYYKGEVIESRAYTQPFVEPQVGDIIHIGFANPNYYEDGSWWIVKERRIIFFAPDVSNLRQTLMINILPDKNKGEWSTSSFYIKSST